MERIVVMWNSGVSSIRVGSAPITRQPFDQGRSAYMHIHMRATNACTICIVSARAAYPPVRDATTIAQQGACQAREFECAHIGGPSLMRASTPTTTTTINPTSSKPSRGCSEPNQHHAQHTEVTTTACTGARYRGAKQFVCARAHGLGSQSSHPPGTASRLSYLLLTMQPIAISGIPACRCTTDWNANCCKWSKRCEYSRSGARS